MLYLYGSDLTPHPIFIREIYLQQLAQLLLALNVWGDCLGEKPYECQVCGQKFSWSSTVAIQATFYDGAGGDPPNI